MAARRFRIERVGRRRRSAARGMARLGFNAQVIRAVLRIRIETALAIVADCSGSGLLWSPAERALFREGRR